MRMPCDLPLLFFSVLFLFFIPEHCGMKVACHQECMLHVAGLQGPLYFYPFRNMVHVCIHLYVCGANSFLLFGLFCSCLIQFICITVCQLVAVTFKYQTSGDVIILFKV